MEQLINKLDELGRPHRQICGLCHRVVAVGFWVPNDVWAKVVHSSRINDIHCIDCFIERADEKLIEWDKDIMFYPTSLISHLTLMNRYEKDSINR